MPQIGRSKKSNPFKTDPSRLYLVKEQQETLSMKHGLFANVPVLCRVSKCPYYKTCLMDPADLLLDEPCPVEIAMILNRFDEYCTALSITEKDTVDMGLVRELVDIEVQLWRADALMAIDASPIQEVLAAVSNDGTPYYKPEIHRAVEMKTSLRKTRHGILTLLNSTRKDREAGRVTDPSTVAAAMIAKYKELQGTGALKDTSTISKQE